MGAYPVPIKGSRVRAVSPHPVIFQCYKTFWVFVAGWVFVLARLLRQEVPVYCFTWWGTVSALGWIPSGLFTIAAVPRLGVGMTVAVNTGTASVLSFLVFWLVLGESMKVHHFFGRSVYLAPVYLVCILLGMAGLVKTTQAARPEPTEAPEALVAPDRRVAASREALGLAFAVLAGVFSAVQYGAVNLGRRAAMHAAGCAEDPARCPPEFVEAFNDFGSWVASFGIGAALVTGLVLSGLCADSAARRSSRCRRPTSGRCGFRAAPRGCCGASATSSRCPAPEIRCSGASALCGPWAPSCCSARRAGASSGLLLSGRRPWGMRATRHRCQRPYAPGSRPSCRRRAALWRGPWSCRPTLCASARDASCRRRAGSCTQSWAKRSASGLELVFAELRYGLAPSVVQRLDFEDIREGTLRLFAIPGFEGDVRLVMVVDEQAPRIAYACGTHAARMRYAAAAVAQSLVHAEGGVQRKRLLDFLHAAAASPCAAKWPCSGEVISGEVVESLLQRPAEAERESNGTDGLFPHQAATIEWMQRIERRGVEKLQVEPLRFAGVALGASYQLQLPCGGVIAHPPGSGKTRIIAALVRETSGIELEESGSDPRRNGLRFGGLRIVAPAHLRQQWSEELRGQSAAHAEVLDYEAAGALGTSAAFGRLVVDEPQDCPGCAWQPLQRLAEEFRETGRGVWQLCGTARSHLDSLGPLLLGWRGWHVAWRQSEWTGQPQLAHLIRTRFLADPPWACLPRPPLEWHNEAVVLRPRESADVAVANLAGFVLDSVLLLSFGASAAFAAAQERDQLLMQMGWYNCVGASLLPVAEHALADWEGTVASRSQQKLQKLGEEIARLEVGPPASVASVVTHPVILRKLCKGCGGRTALAVRKESLGEATFPACAAEWNALLPRGSFRGVLRCESLGGGFDGAVALLWEAADFAKAATEAQAAGAVAAIFAAAEQERPFGYRHEETPPGIPCCMVGPALAAELLAALEMRKELQVEVRVLVQETAEEDRDVEEGLVSAFIANDAVESELHRRLQALRGERERCERSLRFARQMRHLLERNEAHCPVCLAQGEEAEAFAVLPDCFHILCRACLEQQAGMGPSFACPMCRISVFRLDIVVFRAPGRRPAVVVPDGEAPSAESEALETEVPSKLERLLALLGQILADPEERVLVYTQWATHVVYLQKVLEQSGLPALALVGELRDTMDVLSRFGSAGAPRVLLLSSQRHSSGINLQMARHVVIVHPYCTPTATSQDSISRLQMLAFEAQAIGRVRRFPQKKAVHVHRLFAVGSVEEELYRR
ncbi:unnamed protein product [Effrenium voratum]|nr:unnamed protein product [Effrenium voratum]